MSDRSIQQDWKYPNLPPRPFVFKPTASHLDSEDPTSSLSQSPFRGFYNLGVIIGLIFVVTQPIINFMEHGYFLESTLFNSLRVDLLFCLLSWPLFFLW